MRNSISLFVTICCILFTVNTRFVSSAITTGMFKREKGWLFLDRMAFDQGEIQFKLLMKITTLKSSNKQSLNAVLHIVPDYLWSEQITFKCGRIPKTISLLNSKLIYEPSEIDIIEIPLSFKKQRGFQLQASSKFYIKSPVTYNFVFKDCNKEITNEPWRREARIQYQLQLVNGELIYGADQKINNIFLPILIVLTIVMIYFSRRPNKGSFQGQKDWGQILLFITLIFNLLAILFYWVGHIIYASVNGNIYGIFDFMYLCFHSVSQSLLTTLIIFIAYGWTISFVKDAEFDLYVPLISMLGIINLILTLLGKINDGAAEKYHMYDTVPSYLLVVFRLVSVSVMLFGILKEYHIHKKNAKLADFYLRFGILGTIYFFSLPVIMIIACMFETNDRKAFVFIAVQLFKNGVNALMTWMVSSKYSKYSSAKLTSRSFMESENKLL